jgi:hypothetical protein
VPYGWGSLGGVGQRRRLSELYGSTDSLLDAVLPANRTKTGSKAQRRSQEKAAKGLKDGLLVNVGGWADALQGLASALAAAVPSRFGCNWPGCVRLSGVSEGYGLVRGQACVCGGCRQAR